MSNKFDIPRFTFQEKLKVKSEESFVKTTGMDFQIYLKEKIWEYVK